MAHKCPQCGFEFEDPAPAPAPPPAPEFSVEKHAERVEGEVESLCDEGEKLLAQNRGREAKAVFEKAAALDPEQNQPRVWAGLAACRLQAGQFQQALAAADRALALSLTIGALETRACALIALGRTAEASPVLDEVLSQEPDRTSAVFYRGKLFELQGDLAAALFQYQRALELSPAFREALAGAAQCLESLDRPAEALEAYRRASALPQADHGIYLRMAACAERLNDFKSAADYLKLFVAKPPPDAGADLEDAQRRLTLFGAQERAHQAEQRGDHKALAAALRELAQLSPGDRETGKRLGAALTAAGEHAAAAKIFDELLQAAPDDRSILQAKGAALAGAGKFADALACLDRFGGAELDRRAWSAKLKCLQGMGQPEAMLRFCEETLAADAKNPEALFHLAMSAKGTDRRKAAEAFRRFLENADPATPHELVTAAHSELWTLEHPDQRANPQEAASWIQKGEQLAMIGNFLDAASCFEKAVAANPSDGGAWLSRAAMLTYLKRHAEALAGYARACDLHPHNAIAWKGRAAALDQLGRAEEALECWRKVKALAPTDPDAAQRLR